MGLMVYLWKGLEWKESRQVSQKHAGCLGGVTLSRRDAMDVAATEIANSQWLIGDS
jgi:hypothetical protein